MHELALFAGGGGGILGGKLLGWRTVCAVEIDDYARQVLMARQDDGSLPPFPIWDDIRTFDGKPWRGLVDIITGGFPCQDISVAGNGTGIDGARSGLWGEMARIIREVGPRYVLVENSPMLTSRGLGRVLGDLAALGYDARWGVLGAVDAGAPHKRERIWIVADSNRAQANGEWRTDKRGRHAVGRQEQAALRDNKKAGDDCSDGCRAILANADSLRELQPQRSECIERRWSGNGGAAVADTHGTGCEKQRCSLADGAEHEAAECGGWWAAEPDVGRMAHGVASRVDRLRCLGNGQVPAVVKLAWEILSR